MDDEGDLHIAPLSWRVCTEEATTTVTFRGGIDENVDLAALARELDGDIVFDLRGISYINSCGVREWVNLMRSLPRVRTLSFTHCSPAIVAQLNLVYNFRGDAVVRSVYVPYYCRACEHEVSRLFDVGARSPDDLLASLPRVVCDWCTTEMECDELPERYFAFLLVS